MPSMGAVRHHNEEINVAASSHLSPSRRSKKYNLQGLNGSHDLPYELIQSL